MPDEITVNGKNFLNGDTSTIGIIFNNLVGKNITGPDEYREYLKYMEGITGIEIKGEVCRICENGEVLEKGIIE